MNHDSAEPKQKRERFQQLTQGQKTYRWRKANRISAESCRYSWVRGFALIETSLLVDGIASFDRRFRSLDELREILSRVSEFENLGQ